MDYEMILQEIAQHESRCTVLKADLHDEETTLRLLYTMRDVAIPRHPDVEPSAQDDEINLLRSLAEKHGVQLLRAAERG